jgi:hypothetical protein
MTETTPPGDGGLRQPETLWEACVVAAGFIAELGADEAPGEALLPARELVAVVIAGGMYQQLTRRGLTDAEDIETAVREVWLLGEDGLATTMQLAAYSTLDQAPAEPGTGAEQRVQLLADGRASHPDARIRWERVRAAATDAVEAAGKLGSGTARLPVRLADVLDGEKRRRQLQQLQAEYGTED